MQAKIINKEDKRYGKIFEVVERNEKFITIQDGNKKADYGHSEYAYVCCTCGTPDKTGLINYMCTDCFDMSLDIGKGFTKKQKKDLEKRRMTSGYTVNQ